MALKQIIALRETTPQGQVQVGFEYEDTDLTLRRVFGQATFNSPLKCNFYRADTGALMFSATLTTTGASRALPGPDRLQCSIGSEGELVVPMSVAIAPAT